MKRSWCLLVAIAMPFTPIYCALGDYLKPVENKIQRSQVRNVDFIYAISLDKRPDRWENLKKQFSSYRIIPHRFSAVDGWALYPRALNDVGILYSPGMQKCPNPGTRAAFFSARYDLIQVDLNEDCYGKKFISQHFRRGAIGCFLSHLSVLEDAYNSGYNTILVLEDDVHLHGNPHQMSKLIDCLDEQVGKKGWDILYLEEGYYPGLQDERDRNLPEYVPSVWRPDWEVKDTSYLIQHEDVGEKFIKVGLKEGTRCMIIRRAGMKKILDYAKNRGIFLPIDVELAFIPYTNKFAVKKSLMTSAGFKSDTSDFRR